MYIVKALSKDWHRTRERVREGGSERGRGRERGRERERERERADLGSLVRHRGVVI